MSESGILRHHEVTPSCPLPGAKGSCRKHRLRSESDPERTQQLFSAIARTDGNSQSIISPRSPLPMSVSLGSNRLKALPRFQCGFWFSFTSRSYSSASSR